MAESSSEEIVSDNFSDESSDLSEVSDLSSDLSEVSDLSSDLSEVSDPSSDSSEVSDLSSDSSEVSDLSSDSSEVSDLSSDSSELSSDISSDWSSSFDDSSSSGGAVSDNSSSSSGCVLEIAISPKEILCGCPVQVTVTSEHLFDVITLTLPDNTTQAGQSPLIVTYNAKEEDCGQTVYFSATSTNCHGTTKSLDVIKAEFESLTVQGGATEYFDGGNGLARFGATADVTGKIRFTPKPQQVPSNFEVRVNQWVNGHVYWMYDRDGALLNPDDQRIDEDNPPALGRIAPDAYDSSTGILTISVNDTPGKDSRTYLENVLSAIKADLKAADFLQIKGAGGNWTTVGKVEWHWIGGVNFRPPPGGKYGEIPSAEGEESTETPRTPSNP